MNSQRKSGRQFPQSAALHQVGHDARLNAMTAQDGTAFDNASAALVEAVVAAELMDVNWESTAPRFVTILFHSAEDSGDHVLAVPTWVRIPQLAYAAQTARSAIPKEAPIAAHWRDL